MKWSRNNSAHTGTWFALLVLEQSKKSFKSSEKVTMNKLSFWSKTDSPALRATKAKTLATALDNVFRFYEQTKYETGKNKSGAINGMKGILVKGKSTMVELGDKVDDFYRFPKEGGRNV